MAEPIVFKYDITRPFRVARCVGVRKGDFHVLKAAPQGARPMPGSTTLVECPEIMMVLSGAFDMALPGLGMIRLNAGELGHMERVKGAIRISAAEDDSSYVCLTPRKGLYWQRAAGFAPAGEPMTVDVPQCEEAYVYVVTGGLVEDADGTGAVGTLRRVEPGEREIVAAHPTRFLLVWR